MPRYTDFPASSGLFVMHNIPRADILRDEDGNPLLGEEGNPLLAEDGTDDE